MSSGHFYRGGSAPGQGIPPGGAPMVDQWDERQRLSATVQPLSRSAERSIGRDDFPSGPARDPRLAHNQPAPVRLAAPPPPRQNQPNDVEIIVLGKQLQAYAEGIENTLKEMGLKADLMFPKPEISIQTFIENILVMGASFAVFIKPENEAHGSVTVHVLRGSPKPQEHRNMPLKDAYDLIKKHYGIIRRSEFGAVTPRFTDKMNFLVKSQFIDDVDYRYLLNTIHERWQKQREILNKPRYDPEVGLLSEADVSAKINDILFGEDPYAVDPVRHGRMVQGSGSHTSSVHRPPY